MNIAIQEDKNRKLTPCGYEEQQMIQNYDNKRKGIGKIITRYRPIGATNTGVGSTHLSNVRPII